MDKKLLHALIIDDSPDDAELTAHTLRRGGYMPKTQRVQDIAGMQSALAKTTWDVVISEIDVPQLSVSSVLDILRHAKQDAPCIVITRTVSDEDMAKLLGAGVRDIVFKSQSSRLAPVIEREIAVARDRRELHAAQQALTQLQQRYRALVDGSHEAICYAHDGMHTDANRAYLALFGYDDVKDLEEIPVLNLIDKAGHPRMKEYFRKPERAPQSGEGNEFTAIRKDGTRIPVQISISAITMGEENWHQIAVSDISRSKTIEHKLQYLHEHDPLTGLYNRHHFLQELAKAITAAQSKSGNSVLLYIAIEQLKDFNDANGFTAGDRLLLKLAKLFREQLRENDVLARFGGDEFTAILPNVNERHGQNAAKALQKALKETRFSEGDETFDCGCVVNVTVIDATVENVEEALALAHRAYLAGRSPREEPRPDAVQPSAAPTVIAQAPAETTSAAATTPSPANSMAKAIETALRTDGFRLLYQPIVNLLGDASENFEVLVRMTTAGNDMLAAAEFMPIAEQTKLTKAIDHWVVRRAIKTLGNRRENGHQTTFFINLSASALSDDELPVVILDSLRSTGVKGGSLVFEISESTLAEHAKESTAFISSLKKLGCRFAADDFGNRRGGPPLPQPLEFLKIDNTLIHSLINASAGQAVVKELFQSASTDNRRVIVKNVEDAASLAVLWNYGVEYVQGNYFQAPDADLTYNFAGESIDSDEATTNWSRIDR
ncbi:MAG: EAL domain-containing protein [Acidiferrobacterales bacterium]